MTKRQARASAIFGIPSSEDASLELKRGGIPFHVAFQAGC